MAKTLFSSGRLKYVFRGSDIFTRYLNESERKVRRELGVGNVEVEQGKIYKKCERGKVSVFRPEDSWFIGHDF